MDWVEGTLLGVVQGLTEFLPVSSSGHLVLLQRLLGIQEPQLLFDVAVHGGTLLAVLVTMRREVAEVAAGVLLWPTALVRFFGRRPVPETACLAAWVAAGTVPAGLAGLLLADPLERWFGSPRLVAPAMALTGLALWNTPPPTPGGTPFRLGRMGLWRAVGVGLAQAVALVPGVSRSGATVAAGVWLGLEHTDSARFSFLLAVPAIAGAAVLSGWRAAAGQLAMPPPDALAAGLLAAALTGYGAITALLAVLRRGRLRWFALYLWMVATLALAFL